MTVPQEVSVTLFGLDAYFKSFFFLLKFVKDKKKLITYGFRDLFKRKRLDSLYFVVELSWISNKTTESFLGTLRKNIRTQGRYKQTVAVDMPLPWLYTHEPWSVPSYNLVWGPGHGKYTSISTF